jgi:hypothetical protein
MASAGIRRNRNGTRYQVWWLLDDGSQGAETVTTPAEARELQADKQLKIARGALARPAARSTELRPLGR